MAEATQPKQSLLGKADTTLVSIASQVYPGEGVVPVDTSATSEAFLTASKQITAGVEKRIKEYEKDSKKYADKIDQTIKHLQQYGATITNPNKRTSFISRVNRIRENAPTESNWQTIGDGMYSGYDNYDQALAAWDTEIRAMANLENRNQQAMGQLLTNWSSGVYPSNQLGALYDYMPSFLDELALYHKSSTSGEYDGAFDTAVDSLIKGGGYELKDGTTIEGYNDDNLKLLYQDFYGDGKGIIGFIDEDGDHSYITNTEYVDINGDKKSGIFHIKDFEIHDRLPILDKEANKSLMGSEGIFFAFYDLGTNDAQNQGEANYSPSWTPAFAQLQEDNVYNMIINGGTHTATTVATGNYTRDKKSLWNLLTSKDINVWTEKMLVGIANLDPRWMEIIDLDKKDGVSQAEMEAFIRDNEEQYINLAKAICFPGRDDVEFGNLDGSAAIISDFVVNTVGKDRYDIGFGSVTEEVVETGNLYAKWRFQTTNEYFAEYSGTDRNISSAVKATYKLGNVEGLSSNVMNSLYKNIRDQETFTFTDAKGTSVEYTKVEDNGEFQGYSIDGGTTVHFPNTADGWKDFQKSLGGGADNAFSGHTPLENIPAWEFDPGQLTPPGGIYNPDATYYRKGNVKDNLRPIMQGTYTAVNEMDVTYTTMEYEMKKNPNYDPNQKYGGPEYIKASYQRNVETTHNIQVPAPAVDWIDKFNSMQGYDTKNYRLVPIASNPDSKNAVFDIVRVEKLVNGKWVKQYQASIKSSTPGVIIKRIVKSLNINVEKK